MPRDIKIIQSELDALKAEFKAAQDALHSISADALRQLGKNKKWEWKVEWLSPFRFRASCKIDSETLALYAEWQKRFPMASGWSEPEKWHSMSYFLIGNMLLSTGGGSVVLRTWPEKDGKYRGFGDNDPLGLTNGEVQNLRDGIVPESLKHWGKGPNF